MSVTDLGDGCALVDSDGVENAEQAVAAYRQWRSTRGDAPPPSVSAAGPYAWTFFDGEWLRYQAGERVGWLVREDSVTTVDL